MSKSNSPFWVQTAGSVTGVLMVSSLILVFWGRSGGPEWAQWLGPSFFGCMLLIPGILLLIDPQLSISWFRALKPRRRDGYIPEPLLWQRLQTGERILMASGVFVVSAIGVVILCDTIPNLLRVWGI